jgi:hypothetical protein
MEHPAVSASTNSCFLRETVVEIVRDKDGADEGSQELDSDGFALNV